MNLTSRTLISLFDVLNEDSKTEIMSELISRMSIEHINNNPIILQKYKENIFRTTDYLTPQTKTVIEHSYDPFFLFWCYTSRRFLNKLNIRMLYLNLWKFYYVYEGNIHITRENIFLKQDVEKRPFDFQKIVVEENFPMDKIYVDEYEIFEGRMVINSSPKWYESLNIFNFSRI